MSRPRPRRQRAAARRAKRAEEGLAAPRVATARHCQIIAVGGRAPARLLQDCLAWRRRRSRPCGGFYRAWTEGDVPGMLAVVDPDVDADPVLGVLYHRRRYRGHAGIAEWFAEVGELWHDGFEAHVVDARTHGDEVIAFVHLVGR